MMRGLQGLRGFSFRMRNDDQRDAGHRIWYGGSKGWKTWLSGGERRSTVVLRQAGTSPTAPEDGCEEKSQKTGAGIRRVTPRWRSREQYRNMSYPLMKTIEKLLQLKSLKKAKSDDNPTI
jgi:hypothetical protein